MHPSRRTRPPRTKTKMAYRQLWKLVDGGTADALAMHPEYLADPGREKSVRNSITKRVVGLVLGYAVERGAVGDNGG